MITAIVVGVLGLNTLGYFIVRPSPYLHRVDVSAGFLGVGAALLAVTIVLCLRRATSGTVRLMAIGALAALLIGSYLGMQMTLRAERGLPYVAIHDGAVQTEAAIGALRRGQNPYTIDYSSTAFGAFPDSFSFATRPNPAWQHYVYPPLQFLVGWPLAVVSDRLTGGFDIRVVNALALAALVVAAVVLAPSRRRPLVLAVTALNPIFLPFLISGFNDVLPLALLAWSAVGIQRRRWGWAGVALGLACAAKQLVWPAIPALIISVAMAIRPNERRRVVTRFLAVAAAAAGLIILPFFVWSPDGMIQDVLGFASGTTPLHYPISGLGLGQVLLNAGLIRSMWDGFPFWIIQAAIGLPVLIWLARWQWRRRTLRSSLLSATALMAVLLFTARYFNDSHLAALTPLLILSLAAGQPGENDGPAK